MLTILSIWASSESGSRNGVVNAILIVLAKTTNKANNLKGKESIIELSFYYGVMFYFWGDN